MQQLELIPGVRWVMRHPRLAMWAVLSVGMIVLLLLEAGDAGLLATNWLALIITTILVAGLCVWIVSWDDTNTGDALTTSEIQAPPIDPEQLNG
ncbi:MAG: hypothetical protein H7Y11_01450 [Armatimonadetes bacterium]|nr:hypothetical protein [Anaerolineae bacterium]